MKDRNCQYIHELFKIVSPRSILVVNQFGKVKRLHWLFRVMAIVDIPPDIAEGKYYIVDFVKNDLGTERSIYHSGHGIFHLLFPDNVKKLSIPSDNYVTGGWTLCPQADTNSPVVNFPSSNEH